MGWLDRVRIFLVFGIAWSAGPLAAAVPDSVRMGDIEFHPEELAGGDRPVLRGSLSVFEDNLAQSGRKIDLAIAVLPPEKSGLDLDPLFFISGGPGTAASDYLTNFLIPTFSETLKTRAIVVVDQRGTGGSNPLKADARHYRSVQDYMTPTIDVALIQDNKDYYRKLGDLKRYNSLNAVLDLEAVRQAMHFSQINLYATSYGVRPALLYINRFPSRVRTAILKGVLAPSVVMPVCFAKDAQEAFNRLAQKCANDPDCSRVFPHFREEFVQVLAQLKEEPRKVHLKNPQSGEMEEALFTHPVMTHLVRTCLMDVALASQLPYWIHRAHEGDFQPLAELALRIKGFYVQRFFEGMSLCVLCAEDLPRFDGQDLHASTANTFMGRDWIEPAREACRILDLENFPSPDYLTPAIQPTPVLLISGGMDGATPPKNAEEVLRWFPNGRHLLVPNGAHSFRGMTGCVDHIMADFIESGSTENLETGCADAIPFPPFKIKE